MSFNKLDCHNLVTIIKKNNNLNKIKILHSIKVTYEYRWYFYACRVCALCAVFCTVKLSRERVKIQITKSTYIEIEIVNIPSWKIASKTAIFARSLNFTRRLLQKYETKKKKRGNRTKIRTRSLHKFPARNERHSSHLNSINSRTPSPLSVPSHDPGSLRHPHQRKGKRKERKDWRRSHKTTSDKREPIEAVRGTWAEGWREGGTVKSRKVFARGYNDKWKWRNARGKHFGCKLGRPTYFCITRSDFDRLLNR